MIILFVGLIILLCILLGLFVLVQNPKGGGLAANIGGLNNQFMGVKQTNDVLEKGTWIMAGAVALLCLFSAAFIPQSARSGGSLLEKVNTRPTTTNTAPATNPTVPLQQQPATQPPATQPPATPPPATPGQ
jgi:preprotein translocase subunit SecG